MSANKQKSTIFRVRGLPVGPESRIKELLQQAIKEQTSDPAEFKRMGKIKIVPSCYDDINSIAILEWKGATPEFLSTLDVKPSSSYEVELAYEDDERDISFDKHFGGLTQLYNTIPDQPIKADIIAVTGLGGHAYGSFRGRGNLGRMWLSDFLSKDLPDCRTMTYGYDSKLQSRGIETILDYGRGLREEIKKIRRSQEARQRPLIFIAHSFGGIIVAHCLIKAALIYEDEDEESASLYKATYAILFFGTPHRGMVIDDIQKMIAANHPRQVSLSEIEEKSTLLISQLADFNNILRDRKVVSFYEQAQTQEVAQDNNTGSWTRSGGFSTTVGKHSALLQLPDTMETKIPLHLDHSEMVKYDNKDHEGYTSVLHSLDKFIKNAPHVVAARFLQRQVKIKPSSTVPFKRDKDFVGREDIIAEIDSRLVPSSHERVALYGLGGMGKSQIAIEYSYRHKESHARTWVFWVYAGTVERFQKSYRDIAARLQLLGHDDPKVDILQLVSRWLADESNGPWLLILDNADDSKLFSSSSGNSSSERNVNLLTYIPQTITGLVLVTSRNKDAAYKIVGNSSDSMIEIRSMEKSEALLLLQKKLESPQSITDSQDLLAELGYIPLAITQAAAFISRGAPRMNISKYLALFNENDDNRANLLDEDGGDLRRDPEVPNAVITTWQISFNQIREHYPEAAEILSFMCVLNRQAIPEVLLQYERDSLSLQTSLNTLLGFSLITAQKEADLFDMHRLVQLATRRWLTIHEERDLWNEEALISLERLFPRGKYEDWTLCALLLPHAEEILECNFQGEEIPLEKAELLHDLASYLYDRGNYQLSKVKIEQALEIRELYLEQEDPQVMGANNLYGLIFSDLGMYSQAEETHRENLQLRKAKYGDQHPSTLTSMNNLARVLEQQGKYEEAEAMHRQELQLCKEVLGDQHPSTLDSMNNLAIVLQQQGKYEEAEAMHRQTLQLRKEVLGDQHPSTLTSMNNLALVLKQQGKYEEAEAMHRQALQLRKEVLGEQHPSTLTSMNNLGLVLQQQGKYEEAEAMHRQALQLCKEVLGDQHPSTLTSMNNLGSVLEQQGKYEEAKAMHRQALQLCKEVLGDQHPSTLDSMNNLGSVLQHQGKYEEAEAMHRQALQLRKEVLGDQHPSTLTSMNNLALVLKQQGKYEEAEAMHRQELQLCKEVLGDQHPSTLTSINNLALVLEQQGKIEEAELMYREGLLLREAVFGTEGHQTMTSVHNLAVLLGKKEEYDEASALFQRACLGRQRALGHEHPYTKNSLRMYTDMLDEISDEETRIRFQRQYDEVVAAMP